MFVALLIIPFLFSTPSFAGNVATKEQKEGEPLYRSPSRTYNYSRINEQEQPEVTYTQVTLQDIREENLLPSHLIVNDRLTDEDLQILLSKLPSNKDLKLTFNDASLLTPASLKALQKCIEYNQLNHGLDGVGLIDPINTLIFKELTFLNLSVRKKDKNVLNKLAPFFHSLSLKGFFKPKFLKKASQLVSLDLREVPIELKDARALMKKLPTLTKIYLPNCVLEKDFFSIYLNNATG
jgi:hypothetical protein